MSRCAFKIAPGEFVFYYVCMRGKHVGEGPVARIVPREYYVRIWKCYWGMKEDGVSRAICGTAACLYGKDDGIGSYKTSSRVRKLQVTSSGIAT